MSELLVTPEMRLAMRVLQRAGVEFQPTHSHRLDCGCFVVSGWVIAKQEPGLRVRSCSDAHHAASERALSRWDAPETAALLGGVEGHLAMAALLAEEIERG